MINKDELDTEIEELRHKYQDSDDIFKGLSEAKLTNIKGVIDDINELIEQRDALSKALLQDLEKMKIDVNSVLLDNQQHIKLNPELIKERLELRKKLVELDEGKVNEMVNCWRDIALLKKELRERIKEYKEKESNVSLMDKILE